MAEQTVGMRVTKETRELADKIANKLVTMHVNSIPSSVAISSSQGSVVRQALDEFVVNHPELQLSDK